MFSSRRRRRGPYSIASSSPVPRILPQAIVLIVMAVVLYFVGSTLISWIGVFSSGSDRTAVSVRVEGNGSVNVSLDGEEPQKAQDTVPLYTGDSIETAVGGKASLIFFDDTVVRMDSSTSLQVTESTDTSKRGAVIVDVPGGSVWVRVREASSFTGSVVRTVSTPIMTLQLPSGTETVISDGSVYVFEADGLGIGVTVKGHKDPIYIGEGQKLVLPATGYENTDLYNYRSPLDQRGDRTAFVEESRELFPTSNSTSSTASTATGALLTITTPKDGETVNGSIVSVSGSVNQRVSRVRINGYSVNITDDDTFAQDIVFEGTRTMLEIHTEALDARDIILDEDVRTVKRAVSNEQQADAPVITSPAKTGETYRTMDEEIVIKGTVPEGTKAVYVNDYKLAMFKEGDTTWQYLARTSLGNLKPGENTYDVLAVNVDDKTSKPSRLTIILGPDAGSSSSTTTGGTASSSSSSSVAIDETSLPKNAPLMPGSLKVTGPAEGTSYTATESGILISGTTSAKTVNVWVNGYRLQLYKPGKTVWSYIASEELRNMKAGTNTYVINARDEKGMILDTVTYTVTH